MSSESNDKVPSDGDDAEFERVLRNLVNTPHKPHEKKGAAPKGECED